MPPDDIAESARLYKIKTTDQTAVNVNWAIKGRPIYGKTNIQWVLITYAPKQLTVAFFSGVTEPNVKVDTDPDLEGTYGYSK